MILTDAPFEDAMRHMRTMQAEGWWTPPTMVAEFGLRGACRGASLMEGWEAQPFAKTRAFFVEYATRIGAPNPALIADAVARVAHWGTPDGPQPDMTAIDADWDGAMVEALAPLRAVAFGENTIILRSAITFAAEVRAGDQRLVWLATRYGMAALAGLVPNPFARWIGVPA
jgi:hypothetical protein